MSYTPLVPSTTGGSLSRRTTIGNFWPKTKVFLYCFPCWFWNGYIWLNPNQKCKKKTFRPPRKEMLHLPKVSIVAPSWPACCAGPALLSSATNWLRLHSRLQSPATYSYPATYILQLPGSYSYPVTYILPGTYSYWVTPSFRVTYELPSNLPVTE